MLGVAAGRPRPGAGRCRAEPRRVLPCCAGPGRRGRYVRSGNSDDRCEAGIGQVPASLGFPPGESLPMLLSCFSFPALPRLLRAAAPA